jgi:hypothetical protein
MMAVLIGFFILIASAFVYDKVAERKKGASFNGDCIPQSNMNETPTQQPADYERSRFCACS